MKYKTTIKEVKNGYNKIIKLGYCEAQNLLRCTEATAYNSGVYGWNFDLYEVENSNGETVAICTGYRGMAGERPTESPKKYEEKAQKLKYTNWSAYKKALNKILRKWVDENTINQAKGN